MRPVGSLLLEHVRQELWYWWLWEVRMNLLLEGVITIERRFWFEKYIKPPASKRY